MFIATGAPAGVVARGQLGGHTVVLIPDAAPEVIRAIAAVVLDRLELLELEHHLAQMALRR